MDKAELEGVKTEIHKALSANNPFVLTSNIPNSINNSETTINFEPFNQPIYTPKPEEQTKFEGKRPGIIEGISHEWMNWSTTGSVIKSYEKGQALKPSNDLYNNPSDDPIPDNWTPFDNRDLYLDVSRDWWDLLQRAKSPKDQEARYRYAKEQMAKEDYYQKGSIVQKILSKGIGIPGGLVIDLPNLVPFAAAMKYFKASQNFIINASKAIPSLFAIEATKNVAQLTQDPDLDLKEAGYNTIRDTLAGSLLIGGMAGLGRGWEGYKLYRARKVANINYNGIGAKFNLDDKGRIIGYKAEPMPNISLSAAEVNRAQEFYDSQFAKTGLFWFPGVTKLAGLASPIVRGLNSKWGAVRSLTNRMADHDINTVGGNIHVPDKTSFEKRFMNIEADAAMFGVKMEGLRKQYNGIDLTVDEEEALKKLNSSLNKKDPYDPASFGRRVASAVITDSNTQGLEINEAKRMWNEFSDKYWKRYQKAHGFNEETLPLATAKGYLTQVYNRAQIAANEDDFISIVSQGLKDQDELIQSLKRPLDELNEQIKLVKEDILKGLDLEANREELANLKAMRKLEKDKLIQTLRDNPEHNMLLRERNLLNSSEADGLKTVLKPIKDLNKSKSKLKKQMADFKKRKSVLISKLERKQKRKVDNETIQKQYEEIKRNIDSMDSEIAKLESEQEKIENLILQEQTSLTSRALSGDLPSSYFYKHHESGKVVFRDPNDLPKFRPVYESEDERDLAARSLYTSIMNLSDDELMNKQVENLTGIIKENPTYARSVMLPSELFLNNNFLVTDMPAIAHNYAVGLGKASAIQEALSGLGISKTGVDGFYELLAKEFSEKKRALDNLSSNKKAKALTKLTKEFNKEKEFGTDLIESMLGINHDKKRVRQIAQDIRNLAASTRLGFVPLTQISDMMGNIFKHGIWRFIRDGFLPSATTLNGFSRTKNAQDFRKVASEANLAIEHFRAGMVKKFYGYDAFSDIAPANRFSAFLQKAANFSGNLSLSNQLENINQKMTASIVQSKILGLMDKYLKGTISKSEKRQLDRIGLDPETWANPFMEQFKLHGEKGVFGGYQSYYYNWSNDAAKVKMADSILLATRNTIIRKGKADAPFWVNNPVLSLVTQFMGWGFAAFNRYTVPLLQRGEANQIFGTIIMGMVASMEGATRKWARGEEVDFDDENFMAEAFSNSAPFSMLYKSAMFANQFMDNDFLNSMQNDKQRAITNLGMIGGAGFGVINDWARFLQMVGTSDYNKHDISKAARAVPGMQAWWLYQIQQKFIDSATEGLPERRTPRKSS